MARSVQHDSAQSLSSASADRCYWSFLECAEFFSQDAVRALFVDEELSPFRFRVPEANNAADRASFLLQSLLQWRLRDRSPVLPIFIRKLQNRYPEGDIRFDTLAALERDVAAELTAVGEVAVSAAPLSEQAGAGTGTTIFVQAMRALLERTEAVAEVLVPVIRDGQPGDKILSGTGWLVAPRLAVTCRHVLTARGPWDDPATPADFRAQVAQAVFRFDYTDPERAVEYAVENVEYDDPKLDYAIVKLTDRPGAPLDGRRFLVLEPEVPLTLQTRLIVVQHPGGQIQQLAEGGFREQVKTAIRYDAVTAGGASGAPVLNHANLKVVALHRGENEAARLREGTMISAVLTDLSAKQRTLFETIMRAQAERK